MPHAPAAVYRRRVAASEARVWENVRDWEHLPWLHRTSFRSIELLDAGDWGWRAEIGLPSQDSIRLELCIEPDAPRYVSRTLAGPGAGTEIWTRVTPHAPDATDVEVEFHLPHLEPAAAEAVGKALVTLYTRLWDEDEAMMVHRTAALAARGTDSAEAPEAVELGSLDALRERLPLCTAWRGRRVRVLELDGELLAHDARCPHWLGPLDDAAVEDGRLVCPWHGYAFDVRTGRSADGRRLRLAPAPRVEVRDGHVRLVAPSRHGVA